MLLPLDSLVIAPVGQFLSAAVVHLVDALDSPGINQSCNSSPVYKVTAVGVAPSIEYQAETAVISVTPHPLIRAIPQSSNFSSVHSTDNTTGWVNSPLKVDSSLKRFINFQPKSDSYFFQFSPNGTGVGVGKGV